MLQASWKILLELAPWLLIGTAVAGLMHGLLPARLVRGQLRGAWGVVKAVLIGVPMPLCSCGVIPAALGLKKDGASDGASVGFLISTPQTGVDSILVSASFLGWPFALFKVVSAAVTGAAGGWLADRYGSPKDDPPPTELAAEEPGRRGLREMLDHSLMLLRSIWRWLVVGVIASAAIEVLVPPHAMAGLASLGSLGAALVALVVSLPLYVCATASVPIAAALVAAGMPTGAALVFLMAGPATNVATIGVVFRGFGWRTLTVYLTTIIAGSVGFGVLFDFLLESAGGVAAGGGHAPAAWGVPAAIVLLALLVWFAAGDLRRWIGQRRARRNVTAEFQEIAVEGMTCDGCVSRLEGRLRARDDVSAAEVSLHLGLARVTGAIEPESLRETVREAGFKVA